MKSVPTSHTRVMSVTREEGSLRVSVMESGHRYLNVENVSMDSERLPGLTWDPANLRER